MWQLRLTRCSSVERAHSFTCFLAEQPAMATINKQAVTEEQHYIEIPTPKLGATILVDVPKMTLEWNNVYMSVKIKNQVTKQVEEKIILQDNHGSASPGQLVVLMGPSGAGKSSMLDVIAGRNKDFTGSVTVNGHKWNKAMNRYASYVMQDDVFYATLTVKEHLMFQAELRMGKAFNPEEREARVDYVIDELGLTKCRDSQIGGVTDVRGLSGGERKRLSFATEILTNPSLLFVDEPTSGLDSFMAESVVLQLQKLAREGRTVVATIHQPSSELFTLFDQLYLLSGGQTIYNGKACDAVAYFASQGLQCPTYMNPTDYFMRQIIVLDPHSDAATRVDALVHAWKSHVASSTSNAERTVVSDSASEEYDAKTYQSSHLGVVGQLSLLCKRNVTRLVRDTLGFKARVGQTLFIAVIVGLIYLQLTKDQRGIQSFAGAMFFIVINQFFSNATPEFAAVPTELPIMIREYNGGLYHAWVWYLAKNVSELVFQLFFPLVFLVPVYFMVGFGGDADVFITFYLFLVLVSSAAVGLGYMVGCIARHAQIAQILGIVIILPLLIFGGLFLNADNTPVYFAWLEYISPLKYGYRGISRAFWNSVQVLPCDPSRPCLATSGAQVLANMALDKDSMAVDVLALVAINLMFRTIGVVWLWFNIRQKH
ncbi:hypothetical protein DYB34_010250 [Aphanomyces astaci]|uniref:ABC transporter domain-containing protein n=1 Tax=Aphanomyces astaci TaxID=112090 RepID=A0A3R6YLI3_APHAT|nr:hypothetical protein DYB34_010250 [Aphanomyces astaci]